MVGEGNVRVQADIDDIDRIMTVHTEVLPHVDDVEIGTDGYSVRFHHDSIDALKGAEASLTIADTSTGMSLSYDHATIAHLDGTTVGDVLFGTTDSPTLTESQIRVVGNAYTFGISIMDGSTGEEIHDIGGTATVSFQYELRSGQTSSSVRVFYVADDGRTEMMDTWYRDGVLTFTTDHLSSYYVGSIYIPVLLDDDEDEQVQISLTTSQQGDHDSVTVVACVAAAVVVLLMSILLLVVRRR